MDTQGPGALLSSLLPPGQDKNCGNLKKAASRRCNISDTLSLLVLEILICLRECKRECSFYQEHGQRFCQKHLSNRLRLAKEQEDEEAFHKISAIIQLEQQHAFLRKLNYVAGKKRTRSARAIQSEGPGGAIMEHITQDTVERTIFSEVYMKCYTLAGEHPSSIGSSLKTLGTPPILQPFEWFWMAPMSHHQAQTVPLWTYSQKLPL